MTTAKLIRGEVRRAIADHIREETTFLMNARSLWKRGGNWAEAISKGLTGAGSVLAFAASSIDNPKTTDILAFTSGCIGTIGLVLFTYSAYANRESRHRTSELNSMLHAIGVTPLPDIAPSSSDMTEV